MGDEYVQQVIIDLLRHPHRRFLLSHLNGQSGPLTTRRLAQAVVDWEADGGAETPDGATVEQVAVQLHHEHLPRLAAAGVLDYDWERLEVRAWHHPNLGPTWLSEFPVEALYEIVG